MATIFASATTDGPHQIEGYRRAVLARVAHVDVEPRRADVFECEISEHCVGQLRFVEIRSDPVLLRRSPRCIAADREGHYIIAINISGGCCIQRDAGEMDVPVGAFYLLDKALPYQTEFHEHADRMLVIVPRLALEQRLGDPGQYMLTLAPSDNGIGRLAADYVRTLVGQAPWLSEHAQRHAAEACLDLLATALIDGRDAGSCEQGARHGPHRGNLALLSRIKTYIRFNLSDPELGPTRVAQVHGISKRYLHALFAASGTTVGTWIREQRLRRAHADLTDARFSHLTVTDIALRHGFNDIPNFTRRFKATYRVSPRQARVRSDK